MTLKEFKSKEMDINYIYCRAVIFHPLVKAKISKNIYKNCEEGKQYKNMK